MKIEPINSLVNPIQYIFEYIISLYMFRWDNDGE
jgi:hypothetical protein